MHLQEQTRSLGIPTHYFLEVPDYKNPENPNFHHLALIEGLERGNISSVLFGQVVDPAFMLSIRNRGIPTVYFGQMTGDYGSVFLDFPGMIFEGLKAFRQMGCRRVGLITAIFERNLSGVEPADGYNRDYFERVHQLGLDTDPRLVCDSQGVDIREILEKSFYQRGADYVDSILKEFGREDYPDGLLITDDVLASGVLDRLNVVWPRWREELKVMTHSNEGSPIISHYNPYIIRLEIEIGKIASRMISLLQGIKSGNERPEPELLLPHVIGL
ncbi:MAG: substrate-binding domain-containing protein [Verrucomicrobiae bacterium]|nr:substrate-binding domain-containing protein [Verrucomicrobiae bacterium]